MLGDLDGWYAYAAYRAGNRSILSVLRQAEAIHLLLFVLAELLTGFRGGRRETMNRRELDLFLGKPGVQLTLPSRRTAKPS